MENLFIHVIFDIANTTNPIYTYQKDGKLFKIKNMKGYVLW